MNLVFNSRLFVFEFSRRRFCLFDVLADRGPQTFCVAVLQMRLVSHGVST
jgi:hypothetical protein